MRTLRLVVSACGTMLLFSGAALGAPSHLGPTGVVATPTADVIGARQYDVAVDYAKWDVFGEDVKSWPIRLVAGVSDNAEVGVGHTNWKDSAPTMKIVPFNAKVVIASESDRAPAVAVGAAHGKFKDVQVLNPFFTDDLKVRTLYAVATKTLTEPSADDAEAAGTKVAVRGSLGVMYNKYQGATTGSATKPFASLEFATPDGKTTLGVEYKVKEKVTGLKDSALSSVVLRHTFTPDFWAQIGLTNAWYTVANPDCGKHAWVIGVGYRWRPGPRDEWYD